MNWNLFVTELVAGITHGSVYALIALGYSMVYGILKLLNFAHGDVFMVGAFIGYGVLTVFGGADRALDARSPLLLALMFIASMLGGGLLGVVIERFAYRRLRDAPRIAPLITALGVSFFLENAALLLARRRLPELRHLRWNGGVLWSNGLHAPGRRARRAGADHRRRRRDRPDAARSRTSSRARSSGRAMRAVSFDRQAAEMMGIDVNRVIASTFFIGSALAGAAGVFNCLVYQQVWPYMGFDAGLKAFTAAVVGGIGSLPGAVVGGLVIGLAESFATGYLSSTFQDAIVFVILIAVMILRPSGLFGRAAVRRSRWRRRDRPTAEQPDRRRAAHRRRRVGRLARGAPRGPRRHRRPASGSGSSRLPTPCALRRVRRRRGDACRSGRTTTT